MSHTCPVWVGYLLASPIRKLFQHPDKILGPHVQPGMKVLDMGCAMGFFSIPAAKMVGEMGKVYCIDCQEKMLQQLDKRAGKAGVRHRIETRTCSRTDIQAQDLGEQIDLAMAIAMVHEADNPKALLAQVCGTIKPGGKFVVAEPSGHVTKAQVEETCEFVESMGFSILHSTKTCQAHSFVFQKKS